ncbi:class I SAM-dependent methyltransferase family protein [Halostella sp. JP-L12]|uniref:class I SAM-dependent methyltransferase n=1 Tax=Halostella TaxID=1843185 RepID=UPI000EF84EDC|nr:MULTISPECIES: class I SAM-dependent methyltransferase family protein [Halostella]NHN46107.1 class I SAM-dependent methyltransferase family protein [Halostella sp. JP-L12]
MTRGDESDGEREGETASDLAAVVEKARAETAIAELREEGVYDESRKVREYGTTAVALPVTDPPEETDVREVVRQVDPDLRAPDLETLLRERGWTDEEIDRAPGSWAVIGTVILVTFGDCPREGEVGEALLELHGGADTVLANEGVSGEQREPSVRVVAGEGDTETVHTEHGVRYALDLAEVMFSPGNKAERARMGEVVGEGERVFDMFAGVGYFTLPMAKAGARVTATEINPTAFRYLTENAVLNDVQDNVSAYRSDCRDVEVSAERVVMGYYDAHEYLDAALDALEPDGVVHVHEACPEELLWERPVDRLESAAAAKGRTVEVLDRRRVKGHSEGVAHVVVDARVD